MNHSSPALPKIYLLGGLTGSGKTELLHHLFAMGEQVLDLEALCCHDGSAFAPLRYTSQPTSYRFNKQLNKIWQKFNAVKPVFIEQELQRIGNLIVPDWLYTKITTAPVIWLNTDKAIRVQRLSKLVRQSDPLVFCNCLQKLSERMGEFAIAKILQHFSEGNIERAVEGLLEYYDNSDGYAIDKRRIVSTIYVNTLQMETYCSQIIHSVRVNPVEQAVS